VKNYVFVIAGLLSGTLNALAATSTDYRQQKTVTATTEIGTSVYPLPTAGFGVGLFLTPALRLEGNYTKGEIDFFDELSSKLYALRLKYFLGNSFYVNAGASYRELDLVINEWLFSDRRLARSMHHAGGEISFGNSWQFATFTIGCDWGGYFFPLKKTKDTRSTSGSTRPIFGTRADAADDDDDFSSEQRWEDYASSGTWQAVRFHLGWSF
jgi:hypothetical protein